MATRLNNWNHYIKVGDINFFHLVLDSPSSALQFRAFFNSFFNILWLFLFLFFFFFALQVSHFVQEYHLLKVFYNNIFYFLVSYLFFWFVFRFFYFYLLLKNLLMLIVFCQFYVRTNVWMTRIVGLLLRGAPLLFLP